MTPRTAILLAWSIFAALVVAIVVAGAFARKAAAQASDEVPVAGFACNNGLCVTTEAQLENMMRPWYAMQKRILDCPRRGREI